MEQPQAPGNVAQGARCALHYGQPFTAVCQRCGTYMCQTCTESGKFTVCPSCRSRTGLGSFPLRRDGFSWGQITRFAWDVYKRNWALLLVAVIVMFAVNGLFQGLTLVLQATMMDRLDLLLMLQALLILPQMLISSLLALGLMSIAVKLARGEPASLGMLFGTWTKVGPFLLQILVIMAAMIPIVALFTIPFVLSLFGGTGSDISLGISLVPTVLGVVAFVYVAFGLTFAGFEIIAQPNVGAVDGIRNSWNIARSQRLAILLGGIIGMGAIFLGMFACFVGIFFTYGYAMLLFATVYLTLRNGADGLVA
jgi:hypothetical protein